MIKEFLNLIKENIVEHVKTPVVCCDIDRSGSLWCTGLPSV